MDMRMIYAVLLVALAGCQTIAPAPPQGPYRAIGTEPFWDLTIGRELVFTDRGNGVAVGEATPAARARVGGMNYAGRRLDVTIVHAPCSDGMSDRTYPDKVEIRVDGQVYRGCGAYAVVFERMRAEENRAR